MKSFFIFGLLLICSTTHAAENIIYKCYNETTGQTSYLNVSRNQAGKCQKTNLATIDQLSAARAAQLMKNTTSSNQGSVVVTNTTPEQVARDGKRELILLKELAAEKEQLTTVDGMLKNANSKDTEQISKLNEMKQTHQRNIEALEKEIGPRAKELAKNPLPEVNSLSNNKGEKISMQSATELQNKDNLPIGLPDGFKVTTPQKTSNSSENIMKTSLSK